MRTEIVIKQIHDDIEIKHSYLVRVKNSNSYRFFTKYDHVNISYPDRYFSESDSPNESIEIKPSEKLSSVTDLYKGMRENMAMWNKWIKFLDKVDNKDSNEKQKMVP